jgi:hypothetical protein
MSGKTLLKVSRRTTASRSTPDQERFQYLIAQIEKMRQARAAWDANVLEFRRTDAQRVQPVRAALKAATRETVFVIDRLLADKGWSKVDQAALKEIACATAQMLLEGDPQDTELRAVFDRHSRRDFESVKQAELQELKDHAKEFMGVDLDEEDIHSEEDLVERVYDRMKQEEAAREERSQGRRKSAAQQRVEANAQAAKQFLREIYRKLASAVHPDREADAARRVEKNELMQRINRAYATNDLLTLLEAQLRLEQIDPAHVTRLSGERLKQYNKLLSEQLESAKAELRNLEAGFCVDHGLPQGKKLTPQMLHLLVQQRARELRAHVARQKRFLEVLASKAATKRWLKEQRRFPADWDDNLDA